MTDRSRNIMVGVTTIAGLVAFAVLLMLFGYVPSILEPGYTAHARIADSQGINDASRVWLYGIDVGQVEKVTLLPFPQRGVDLTMRLREGVKLPLGTRVNVIAPLLGGTPSIALDTSRVKLDEQTQFMPIDGSAMLESDMQITSMESRVAKELRSALESAAGNLQTQLTSRLDKYETVIEKIDKLSTEWTQVAQNLNQITSPRTPQEVDAGAKPGNLSSVVVRMDDRIKELKESIDAIHAWTSDDKLHEDVRMAAANARKLTEKMDTSLDQLNKVTASADRNLDKLSTRFIASADDLSATIASMRKTIDDIHEGKGTAGKFITDPALYNNLNDSVQRIGKAADEFKIMMEKWRKEGLPLQF